MAPWNPLLMPRWRFSAGSPQQAPRPETKARSGHRDENEPRVLRQVWPFLEYAPTMRESEQGKKRAGGHDISLHGRASETRICCGKGLSVGTYLVWCLSEDSS